MSEMVGVQKAFIEGYTKALHDSRLKLIALEIEIAMGYSGGENGMVRNAIKQIFAKIRDGLKELGGQNA